MRPYRYSSSVEQLATHLRGEIHRGELVGEMPGVDRLAAMLGCSQRTVLGALKRLEHEGLLVKQGAGRRSRITSESGSEACSLRVAILLCLAEDIRLDYIVDLQHQLDKEGHTVIFPSRSLSEMKMDLKRVSRLVASTSADVWVLEGASREVLAWFLKQTMPAFALFGRRHGLPIAGIGPDKEKAYRHVTRHLLGLGHRRIVLLARPSRLIPTPGLPERAFLEELAQAGIKTGSYNIPQWDGTIDDLHGRVDAVFQLTPPTALIIDESPIFLSVQHHLARRHIFAPEHVSLICTDGDPYFSAMRPSVAHIQWSSTPMVRRIVQWAGHVSRGVDDRRQSVTKTTLAEGETIGPAAKGGK